MLNNFDKKYKEFLKLEKRYNELWDLISKQPLIKLEKPYTKGWVISYVLKEDIPAKYDRNQMQILLDKYYGSIYTNDVKVVKAIRRDEKIVKRRNKISLTSDYFPSSHYLFDEKELNPDFSQFYIRYENQFKKVYYKLDLIKYLKIRVRPNIITHTRGKDGKLESERDKLRELLYHSGKYEDCLDYRHLATYPKYKDRTKIKSKINKFKNGDIEDIYNEKIPQEYYW